MPSEMQDSTRRRRVERFIEDEYRQRFGSVIVSHYPTLMSLQTQDHSILAALGIRQAVADRLFLEQYFDVPIERLLSHTIGKAVRRDDIVEIGNLASSGKVSTARLIVSAALYLSASGSRYAVATATDKLQGMLTSFGFEWFALNLARPDRLPDRGRSWGNYYRCRPQVIMGAVGQTAQRLRKYQLKIELLE